MAAALRVFSLLLLLGVSACGGGGGGATPAEEIPSGGWVTINSPTSDSSYTTNCNSVALGGEAFVSPDWWECCVGSAEQMAGVTVTVNGVKAYQWVRVCYLLFSPYICDHYWQKTIDLALGENQITVTASDPDGRMGVASITVVHPQSSYAAEGTITDPNGAALSSVDVTLTATNVSRTPITGEDGTYRVTCLDDGSYTITPSKSGYYFTPESRSIVISSADVLGQDFVGVAVGPWTVSGAVRSCTGCPVNLQGYALNGEFVDLATTTDQLFQYSFSVPNGTYDITVKHPTSPSSITVIVYGADVVNQDFLATLL